MKFKVRTEMNKQAWVITPTFALLLDESTLLIAWLCFGLTIKRKNKL